MATQQPQPQRNENLDKKNSPNPTVAQPQKADIRRPSEREFETEDGSPEEPFRPATPDREVPDVRAERDSTRQ